MKPAAVVLSWSERGKTRLRTLPPGDTAPLRHLAENHRRFRQDRAALVKLHRQTPCDQDFLRKFARDTKAGLLHGWFNREVPRCLRPLGLFDPEGLFIGDASYLFVPDNEHYEQSDLLCSAHSFHAVLPPPPCIKANKRRN